MKGKALQGLDCINKGKQYSVTVCRKIKLFVVNYPDMLLLC